MDVALRESRAKWKVVVGHHTIKSAGHHGNTDEVVAQLLPILEVINSFNSIRVIKVCEGFYVTSIIRIRKLRVHETHYK